MRLVVFDPPHLTRADVARWMRAMYRVLTSEWREDVPKALPSVSVYWNLRES